MSIHSELKTSDSADQTVGMSTASAIAKALDWTGPIGAELDYAGHCPSQTEYRDKICPTFEQFLKRYDLTTGKWKESRFVYSDAFPGSELRVLPPVDDAEYEETQPHGETDGYDSFTLDDAIGGLLSA